ncbi:thioredoxin-like negative regulator of GroEL [Pseudomonas sp. JUb42]|jgi:thioredoxin-like negative regulator of GroEL|uniref:thioredoxin family protein n=1 Tax=Pseudomonas sp. JUb42 TaxID=2940611 RepID=UPI00216A8883|nr:thioredoxin [Pseudomonas sp. JUb42]MCS3472781.1 thioredoxin-like negative regulator of GroEL [Pseudomonas sp. JUb42]
MSVIVVNEESFENEVTQSEAPVVVEFSQPGVNEFGEPDKSARTGEIIDKLANEYADKVKFVRAPEGTYTLSGKTVEIRSVPVVLFFKAGEQVDKTSDFHLVAWYRQKIKDLWDITMS